MSENRSDKKLKTAYNAKSGPTAKKGGESPGGSEAKNKGGRPKRRDRFDRVFQNRAHFTQSKNQNRTTPKKKQWILDHYLDFNGNATALSNAVGIGRRTFYDWFENDPKFKEGIEDALEGLLDRAEDYLNLHITLGSETSLIFLLKCKGKSRGYIERQEITGSGGAALWEIPEWMVPSEKKGKKIKGKNGGKNGGGNGQPD